MTRNKQKTEKELLADLERLVSDKLPQGWSLSVDRKPEEIAGKPDVRLIIVPPKGAALELLVDVRTQLTPRDVQRIVERLEAAEASKATWALMAPWVSPLARTRILEAGLGYADSTGTAEFTISSDSSSYTLSSVGASTNPYPQSRPLASLKGPASARVIRALCDFSPPYSVTELAERSGASAPVVSKVLAVLDSDGLIERKRRGPTEKVDWAGLIERWSQDYSFSESNQVRACLEPRGAAALFAKLRSSNVKYALTGPAAVAQAAKVAPERSVALFVDDLPQVKKVLGLSEVDAGANVLLAEPFDEVVFDRTFEEAGLVLVSPSQAAADLATGPGRWPAQGQALIAWMKDNEDVWRS